ncbi:hypothetical protein M1328_04310 [Patescibacteria group bacterium]|nr:hypothetical protein [Patescibacteria group bacterium]
MIKLVTVGLVKKAVDYGIWALFFAIFGYSSLFYVTRNTLPGNFLYGTKLGVERVMTAAGRLLYQSVNIEMEFVGRRFNEVTKVLASKYGPESLKRLDVQITETANSIADIKDPVQRKAAAAKYVAQLNYISSSLDQEQQQITVSQVTQPAFHPPTMDYNPGSLTEPTSQPASTSQTTTTNSQPSSTTAVPSIAPITNQIDTTQQTIQNTITQMNQIQSQSTDIAPTDTPAAPTAAATPTQQPSINSQSGSNTNNNPTMTPTPTTIAVPADTNTPVPSQPTATPTPKQGWWTNHHDGD